jgi:hypothetical protein
MNGWRGEREASLMNYSFDAKACNKTSSYLAGLEIDVGGTEKQPL